MIMALPNPLIAAATPPNVFASPAIKESASELFTVGELWRSFFGDDQVMFESALESVVKYDVVLYKLHFNGVRDLYNYNERGR